MKPCMACNDLFLDLVVVLSLQWYPRWCEGKMRILGIKEEHTSWESWPLGYPYRGQKGKVTYLLFLLVISLWLLSYTNGCSEVPDSSHVLPAESQRPFMCSMPCTGTTELGTARLKASVSVFPGSPKAWQHFWGLCKGGETELLLTEGLSFRCDL